MDPLPPKKPQPSPMERLRYVFIGLVLVLTGSCAAYVGLDNNRGLLAPTLGIIVMVGGLVLMVLGRRWSR